ncbi:MAG: MGMT family protein [Acidimicrobiaceae bacterium]|nr:MGMT family protein [Acidimicrobiaceae bacterium]
MTGAAGEFRDRVLAVICALAPGEVVSYGDIAAEAGYPGAARAVGSILAGTDGLPWWRVVNATGRLVPGHEAEHARRLAAEGVPLVGGRVPRGDLHPPGPGTPKGRAFRRRVPGRRATGARRLR